jgi:hypothetical protein
MGIARKGSRTIDVNSTRFRWVVSPDSGAMILVVELAENPGQRLEARFSYDDEPDGTSGRLRQRSRITPKIVRATILAALSQGWRPEERGLPPKRLDRQDG